MSDHNTDPNRGQVNRTTVHAPSTSGTNPIIWVVIAVLVVAALAWYFMSGGNDTVVTEGDNVTITTEAPDTTSPVVVTEDPAVVVEDPAITVEETDPAAPAVEAPAN